MSWKPILTNDDKPNYYHGVKIFVNGQVFYDWHRLSGDYGEEYYGSLNTNLIIEGNITHWAELDTEKRSVIIEKIPAT